MVAKRVLVVCDECGSGYTGRKVGEKIVVATDDGRCVCGHPEFSVGQGNNPTPTRRE